MAATAPVRFVRPRRNPQETGAIWLQLGFALAAGFFAFFVVLFLLSIGYRVMYAGRIFPGVSVAGVDVSGMKLEDAAVKIQMELTYPYGGRIVFRDGANVWLETPARLGMVLDPTASARAAFDLGRSGGLFKSIDDQVAAMQGGVNVSPVTVFDQRVAHSYLQNLAVLVDRPVTEASLVINGLDVTSSPGQVGRRLNVDATLVYLSVQMQSFRDGEVPLVIIDTPPHVLDATPQAEAARRLLAAPFTLSIPEARANDPGPWQIQPAELAPMLQVGRVKDVAGSDQYVVQVQPALIQPYLESIGGQINRPDRNARFIFSDETAQLQLIESAIVGLELDLPGSIAQMQSAVAAGQQSAFLAVNATKPQVDDDAVAAQLGITQLVATETSYFRGSSAARLQNIEAAAAKFHGLLVAPGATFSMGEYMGDISLDNGFAEALIIYGGKTIKGVGGGVCQVSTTLFRTVFFGGFPVAERHAHAYRVSYYEQRPGSGIDPRLAGLDATVYFPLVDFKFVNDTPYWLLMETYFNPTSYSLTWKIYSTSDGRTVAWETTGPTEIVSPQDPVIQLNPDLGEEEIKQVEYAADGANISVDRIVYNADGKIRFVDKFQTFYEPWRAVCEYGPGVKDAEKIFKKRGLCQPG